MCANYISSDRNSRAGRWRVALVVWLAVGGFCFAGERKLDLSRRYVIVRTDRENEVKEAAGAGFRMIAGGSWFVLMEKVAVPPDVYRYQRIHATASRGFFLSAFEAAISGELPRPEETANDFLSKVNQFGALGYRLVIDVTGLAQNEDFAWMEKPPGRPNQYSYYSYGVGEASPGYRLLPGTPLLEKAAEERTQPTNPPTSPYLTHYFRTVCCVTSPQGLTRELEGAARDGYHIVANSSREPFKLSWYMPHMKTASSGYLSMEKTSQPDSPYQYRVILKARSSALEQQITEAAAAGFRLLAFDPPLNLIILEKPPAAGPAPQYRILGVKKDASALIPQIERARDNGFTPIAFGARSHGGFWTVTTEWIVILERQRMEKEAPASSH